MKPVNNRAQRGIFRIFNIFALCVFSIKSYRVLANNFPMPYFWIGLHLRHPHPDCDFKWFCDEPKIYWNFISVFFLLLIVLYFVQPQATLAKCKCLNSNRLGHKYVFEYSRLHRSDIIIQAFIREPTVETGKNLSLTNDKTTTFHYVQCIHR